MIEKLLTIEEVAEITGIAVKTIYTRGSGTKTLPRIKLGGALRFRESDVRDWINRHVERPYDPRKAFRRTA
jgi:excisionase family DNA binding protein